MDDVLDPDDRHALGVDRLDGGDQLVDLALGEAAGDLVEQQHPRLRGQGPGQLQALALEQGEARRPVTLALREHAGALERLDGRRLATAPAAPRRPGEPKVLPTSTFSNTVSPRNGWGIW